MVLTGPLNQLNSVSYAVFDLQPFTLQVTLPDDLEGSEWEVSKASHSKIYADLWKRNVASLCLLTVNLMSLFLSFFSNETDYLDEH